MLKSPSNLSLSSSDSYQSLTDLTIECCICLEEVENKDSYMPDCLHSWCKQCNDKLNNCDVEIENDFSISGNIPNEIISLNYLTRLYLNGN